MTLGPALPCPKCKRVLESYSWHDAGSGSCRRCETEFDFTPFPALTATRSIVVPQAAELAADSVCFFHAENRAETICEGCGRLLCPVCTVKFSGQKLCPTCIAGTKSSDAAPTVRDRTLFDGTALAIALIPLLMWPFTLITAPVALGFVIYGWKKPGSLVRGRSRVRFVLAAVCAVLEIGGWVAGFIYLALKR